MNLFRPIFKNLLERHVKIYIITRDPKEHDEIMALQAEEEIRNFECIGVQALLCSGNHHIKLAILDRTILWEGSLNILSQTYSREIIRRIAEKNIAMDMIHFLRLDRFI